MGAFEVYRASLSGSTLGFLSASVEARRLCQSESQRGSNGNKSAYRAPERVVRCVISGLLRCLCRYARADMLVNADPACRAPISGKRYQADESKILHCYMY